MLRYFVIIVSLSSYLSLEALWRPVPVVESARLSCMKPCSAFGLYRSLLVGGVLGLMALQPSFAAEPATIRACTFPAAGFFTREGSGPATGLEFDLLSSFATKAKLTITFDLLPSFDQLLKDTEAGRCQIGAATITATEDRKARFLFSTPYFPNRIVLVQKTSTGFTQETDLKDRRVAVVKGTISADLVGRIPGVKSVLVDGDDAAFEALLKGEADVLACDSAVVLYYLARNSELGIAFPIGAREFFAFALPKDSRLATPLNRHLKDLVRSGEFTRLLAKHFPAADAKTLAAEIAKTQSKSGAARSR